MSKHGPWDAAGKWHVSEYNFTVGYPSDVGDAYVVDCTLREGDQTPGVVMSRKEKLALAEELDAVGFRELEIGMPAVSAEEAETARQICALGLRAELIALCRAKRDDIELAAACGARTVSLSLPLGYLQLEHKLKWSVDRVVDTTIELTRFAHECGLRVTLSPYDTVRASLADLTRYLEEVHAESGPERVRLVDTVGCALPSTIAFLVQTMRAAAPIPVEVHCHDDFGLATANTLSGLRAGAAVASTTINGIGERAGNAATEEVVAALEMLCGVRTGIDMTRLTRLSREVALASGMAVQRNKAIVGENAFAQEAGMVVSGFLAEPFTAIAYTPDLVGQESKLLLGKKSGTQSIRAKLVELDIGRADDATIATLVQQVKSLAEQQKSEVSDSQFLALSAEHGLTPSGR